MTSFSAHVDRWLSELDAQQLRRRAREINGPQGPWLLVDGRRALCLCSNNYLGLAAHPVLLEATRAALAEDGLGSGASRLISGSMAAHREAEGALAGYLRRPASVLFSSGYACNVGTLQALAGPEDIIFSDALNHASLIDGARLSRAKIRVFAHGDPDDLARLLRQHRSEGRAALVVTESLFSMDGDMPPLAPLAELARAYDAGFVVDEAHALGVYGPRGRGLCAEAGIEPDVVIGTLGKAIGAQGAFAAGAATTVDLIRNRARSYVFSTAPSPALARTAVAALALVERSDERRAALLANVRTLREGLRALSYEVLPGESPILAVMVGDPGPTMALSAALLERGVFAHGIRPPTVPPGTGRLRVVPMATHNRDDLDYALRAFEAVR